METLELNPRAKGMWEATQKIKRRRDMAVWRKQKQITFMNHNDFFKWLEYTKWHKRPHIVKDQFGFLQITFLDNMKGAK